MDLKVDATNHTEVKFNFTDIMNIQAISRKKTPLWQIMRYWDAYNRSYPSYAEFIESINKLTQFEVIQINENGRFMTCTNRLFKKMTFIERCKYFFNPSQELISSILSKYDIKTSSEEVKINEQDYHDIIQEYSANANG